MMLLRATLHFRRAWEEDEKEEKEEKEGEENPANDGTASPEKNVQFTNQVIAMSILTYGRHKHRMLAHFRNPQIHDEYGPICRAGELDKLEFLENTMTSTGWEFDSNLYFNEFWMTAG
eukprot:GHVU01032050.1.p3 GENE.GHVU01032050.1~~GHVU01032050.1.p3  ORF type:complete len:118 (+),score=20.68 GHVU01032050.1:1751-2104(+)